MYFAQILDPKKELEHTYPKDTRVPPLGLSIPFFAAIISKPNLFQNLSF